MTQGLKSEIDEKTYLKGFPLNEAIFEYGSPEAIQNYNDTARFQSAPNKYKKADSVTGILAVAVSDFKEIQVSNNKRQDSLLILHGEITTLIKNGTLIPYCYQSPRKLSDNPVKIPIDIFIAGKINWDNSELIYKNLEFTGIRLIQRLKEIAEIKPIIKNDIPTNSEKFENSKKSKGKKINPPIENFDDLDSSRYIDEKQAAQYLGISHRTLQGYRTKGGGPEFKKFSHKSVRYKMADLIKWTEDRKRRNTSK